MKFADCASLVELPVAIEHAPDECGLGFVMRSAAANGLTLQRLLGWLQAAEPTALQLHDVRRIAYVTRVSARWLSDRLPQRLFVDGQSGWSFLGEYWSRSIVFRGREAQVCPQCLHVSGYCRAVWRLATISACTKHRQLLVDRCGACGRPIAWTRPTVDVCQCRRHLKSSTDGDAPLLLVQWSSWVERRVLGAPSPASDSGLPAWFDLLTVDGASCLVHLMGVRERPHQRIAAATAAHAMDTTTTASQTLRGLHRLFDLDPDRPETILALSPFIHDAGLQLLARGGTGPGDRRLAERWLAWVAGRPCTQPTRGGRARNRQLSLFD